jgi:2,3-bisphosphoglycerate-independent phosphoglycerate mutase
MGDFKRNRKFVLLVGDGMADYPLEELDGKTPLEAANTPYMDRIAAGRIGLAQTIPEGMEPGSDIANLSLLGYDPKKYHTGRGPLEAAAMDVRLKPSQVAFRMNLVTLNWRSDHEIIMISHNSGNISTAEGSEILGTLRQKMVTPAISLHPGVSFRHLLVWEEGPENAHTIPPHDVLDQNVGSYFNKTEDNPIPGLIRNSWEILKIHPVNIERGRAGKKEANSIWPWGQGKPPVLPLFKDRYGLRGGVISAVDLLKGIGIYAGFDPIHVEGMTGYLDTNYMGKAEGALKGLATFDFIFLHVEAPDEASHNGEWKEKIQAIEDFDRKVVGTVLEGMKHFEDYRIMVASDHLTPIIKRTHSPEPTPFAWAGKKDIEGSPPQGPAFTEDNASKSGYLFEKGHELMAAFLFGD